MKPKSGRRSGHPVDGSEIWLTTERMYFHPVKNGIFTISTGEFTGVLNHQPVPSIQNRHYDNQGTLLPEPLEEVVHDV